MANDNQYVAIDPMALVLSGKAYLIWIEKKHPHVPKVAEIREALRSLSAEDRAATLKQAQTMAAYAKAVEEAVGSKTT